MEKEGLDGDESCGISGGKKGFCSFSVKVVSMLRLHWGMLRSALDFDSEKAEVRLTTCIANISICLHEVHSYAYVRTPIIT